MRFKPPSPPNSYDAFGFKDDEDEVWHEMHQTRLELNAKFTCLGYVLLLIGMAVVFFFSLFL